MGKELRTSSAPCTKEVGKGLFLEVGVWWGQETHFPDTQGLLEHITVPDLDGRACSLQGYGQQRAGGGEGAAEQGQEKVMAEEYAAIPNLIENSEIFTTISEVTMNIWQMW